VLAAAIAEPTRTSGAILSTAEPHVCAPIDTVGNLVADGTRSFEWNSRNQLVALEVGAQRAEYQFDGAGRRVRSVLKEAGKVQAETRQLWCELELCEERSNGGAIVTRRSFVAGQQVDQSDRFLVRDHLGSAVTFTDSSSSVTGIAAYDPWGRQTVSGTMLDVDFTGHSASGIGGIVMAAFRSYDSSIGRWLSQDPIGIRAGLNMLAYVENNPVSATDPLGLQGVAFPPPLVSPPSLPGNYPRPDKRCCDANRLERAIQSVQSQRQRMRTGRSPSGTISGSTLSTASCDPSSGWCTPWPPDPPSQFNPNTSEADSCVRYCITVHEWTHWNDRRRYNLKWSDDQLTIHREWPGYDQELKCLVSFR
jgi:RHS repeat-associated protein